VPASKSDVFRDRSLSIPDKRALMAFLNSSMQAAQGEGPLKVRDGGVGSGCC
jgi:RAB protein geranylgeranyltransferase component A